MGISDIQFGFSYIYWLCIMNPTRMEHFLDSLGSTLSLTFVFYAIFELILLSLFWRKRKEQSGS